MEYLKTYESFFKNLFKKEEPEEFNIEMLKDILVDVTDDYTLHFVDVIFAKDRYGRPEVDKEIIQHKSKEPDRAEIFPIGSETNPDYAVEKNPVFKKGIAVYDHSETIFTDGHYSFGNDWMDETQRWYKDEENHLREIMSKLDSKLLKSYKIGYGIYTLPYLTGLHPIHQRLSRPYVILFYQMQ